MSSLSAIAPGKNTVLGLGSISPVPGPRFARPRALSAHQAVDRFFKCDISVRGTVAPSPSTTLYVHQQASPGHVSIAPFDAAQGKALASKDGRPAFQSFIERRGQPRWSADGRHLLFFSCGIRNWPCKMSIRDGNTGDVREVSHEMRYIAFPALAPDGHAVIAAGGNVKGRGGIHLIDGTTGTTTLLVGVSGRGPDHRDPQWRPDGKAIRYNEFRDKDIVLLERQMGSEESREIFRTVNESISRMDVSPDGQSVGFFRRRGTGMDSYRIVVAPLAGGASRELLTPPCVRDVFFWQWAPESQSVILQKSVGVSEGIELWQVPLAGSPRKLDVDGRQWSSFHISPDGKQIAFEARTGKAGNEVWALENFPPAQTAKK